MRGKFIAALVVAAIVPLLIGLFVLQTLGFRHLLAERGRIHEVEAGALSSALGEAVAAKAARLRTWIRARPVLVEVAVEQNARSAARGDGLAADTAARDAAWAGLDENAPLRREILDNAASRNLREFLAGGPAVAEVMATDRHGRLIAATRTTSDYDQADEEWWRQGIALGADECWQDVLHFDASSEVYSLDVVFPLRSDDAGLPVGVVKMVVEVSPLFGRVGSLGAMGEQVEVVLPDGRVIARPGAGPDEARSMPVPVLTGDVMLMMQAARRGWTTTEDAAGEDWMTGFAAIESSVDNPDGQPGGYVLFSSRRSEVVSPVRRQLLWVAAGTGLAVIGCAVVGYWLVHHGILRPLETLREAARAVAGSARIHLDRSADVSIEEARQVAERDLLKIEGIRTGDEIEALAADVGVMTSRVLNYQRELEAEVRSKTAMIREDLEMAREFQLALLPTDYPSVVESPTHPMGLGFAHYYQPASTVGGDFFDLIELADGRIGVLIADVMGHGARSALVTAILRALVRNHAPTLTDPGSFLEALNRHLHELISRSGQALFVSAYFMVLDTEGEMFSWAVAGHPAPLRARRGSGRMPEPLWTGARHQPALGLVESGHYRTHEERLWPGDVFLLYTDGVIEAENRKGEEYGTDRLAKALDDALDGPLAAMPAQIVASASSFRKGDQYDDDVCLVVVETRVKRTSAAGSGRLAGAGMPSGA